MSAGTAGTIVTKALRLLNVLDQEEAPTSTQLALGTEALSDLLRHTWGDATASFQVKRDWLTLPPGRSSFVIADTDGADIRRDAKAVRTIFAGSYSFVGGTRSLATNRELHRENEQRVHGVMIPGDTATRYRTEEGVDDSLTVHLWPAPARVETYFLVSTGVRVPVLKTADDVVQLPSDAINAAQYLLAKALRSRNGVALADVADVIAMADQYELEWRTLSRQNTSIRLRRRSA